MAIVSITEQIDGWGGGYNERGEYEFTRTFLVLGDTRNVGPKEALAAQVGGISIPQRFDDYHAGDDTMTTCWVRSAKARRDPIRPELWYVTIVYSNSTDTQNFGSQVNPMLRPKIVQWGAAKYSKPVDVDLVGTPIRNTAGDFYDPLPEIDDSRPALRITRNEDDPWNFSAAIQYQDAINTDMFYGFQPYQAKIESITATEVKEEEGWHYWAVQYEIHFRREGWRLVGLSRGKNQLVGGNLRPIMDPTTKQPVSEPRLLDENGAETTTPYYQTFRVYKELAFGPLDLED